MLTPKQEAYYILSSDELDQLIQQHFKKPNFFCVANYEWTNDSEHIGIVRCSDLEDDDGLDNEGLREFLSHPNVPPYPVHWSILLADLARREVVPEGNYLIEVCW